MRTASTWTSGTRSYPAESLPRHAVHERRRPGQVQGHHRNSSVGQTTFRTAYTMKDGTVVNEQAAFEGYIRNGGGFVAIHGGNDSMGNWPFYLNMIGGVFRTAPGQRGRLRHGLRLRYNAELDHRRRLAPGHAGLPGPLPGDGRAVRVQPQAAPVRAPAAARSTTTRTARASASRRPGGHRGRGSPDHVLQQLRGRPLLHAGRWATTGSCSPTRRGTADDPPGHPDRRRAQAGQLRHAPRGPGAGRRAAGRRAADRGRGRRRSRRRSTPPTTSTPRSRRPATARR